MTDHHLSFAEKDNKSQLHHNKEIYNIGLVKQNILSIKYVEGGHLPAWDMGQI